MNISFIAILHFYKWLFYFNLTITKIIWYVFIQWSVLSYCDRILLYLIQEHVFSSARDISFLILDCFIALQKLKHKSFIFSCIIPQLIYIIIVINKKIKLFKYITIQSSFAERKISRPQLHRYNWPRMAHLLGDLVKYFAFDEINIDNVMFKLYYKASMVTPVLTDWMN